jgi:Domain of unknown function (DUF397)
MPNRWFGNLRWRKRWRKSSWSAGDGACVEVANCKPFILVRDSKMPKALALKFEYSAWLRFTESIKNDSLI